MTETTRKRLLELWEKVPETRPDGLEFLSVGMFWLHDSAIPEGFAVLAVCGKLCEWLVSKCGAVEINEPNREIKTWCASVIYDGNDQYAHGNTMLDAVLSAAEAVAVELAAKGDAMSTEEIWSQDAAIKHQLGVDP